MPASERTRRIMLILSHIILILFAMSAAMELDLIPSSFQVVKSQQLEWCVCKYQLKKSFHGLQCNTGKRCSISCRISSFSTAFELSKQCFQIYCV
jgi:hypothetical protein